jgi:hypothetical protein
MPLLSVHNHFTALFIDKIPESTTIPSTDQTEMKAMPSILKTHTPCIRCLKWGKHLLNHYTIAANTTSKFLELKISLQMTDTGTIIPTKGLLDCRANDLFVHSDFVSQKGLTT